MWIKSHPSLSVRRRFVSPPGYQSPALGDSVPVPGSQEAQHETLQPRDSTPALSHVPRLFASVIPSRTHQEVDNEHRISHLLACNVIYVLQALSFHFQDQYLL